MQKLSILILNLLYFTILIESQTQVGQSSVPDNNLGKIANCQTYVKTTNGGVDSYICIECVNPIGDYATLGWQLKLVVLSTG
jgi:hypothetical protein